MHEHVGHQLPWFPDERNRVQCEPLAHQRVVQVCKHQHQEVDDDYMLYSFRHIAHEAATAAVIVVIAHILEFLFDVFNRDQRYDASSRACIFRIFTCEKAVNQSLCLRRISHRI